MLEACYAGSFVNILANPQRMIVASSSSDQFSFFSPDGAVSFGQFFSNRLMTGETWEGAFDKAVADITKIGPPYAAVNPQKSIGSAVTMSKVYGDFTMGSLSPELKTYTLGASVNATLPKEFNVQLGVADAAGISVWALVTPPNYQPPTVSEAYTTPALNLDTITFTSEVGTPDYSGSYTFPGNGLYTVTYYVKDSNGMVVSSPPQTFDVSGGLEVTTTTSTTIAPTTTTTVITTTTTTIPVSASVPLSVSAGWNLLSSAIGFHASTVLSDSATFLSVWKWTDNDGQVAAKTWGVYLPGGDGGATYAQSKGFLTLSEIKAGEGFWINSTGAKQVAISGTSVYGSVSLSKGWNLAGLKDTKSMAVVDLGAVTSVWKWVNNNWAVYLPTAADKGATYANSKGFGQFDTIQPTEGFWVDMP